MRTLVVLVAGLTLSGCVSLIGGDPHHVDRDDGPATLVIYRSDARLIKALASCALKPSS